MAFWGLAGRVGIWETSSGQRRHMLEGPGGAIEWLHWHPKGDVILAGTDEFTVWLWNAQTGACMQVQLLSNAQRCFFSCLWCCWPM